MTNLNEIFEAWLKATNRDIEDNKIRMGVESDWLCMKAKDFLKDDPSGFLTVLTLRSAYKSFIKNHQLSLEDLLKGEWDEIRPNFERLHDLLFKGEAGSIYNSMMAQVIKNTAALGKTFTFDEIENIGDAEKVLTKAIEEFTKRLKHECFMKGENVSHTGGMLPKMFHFTHFRQFVDALKTTPKDNFICVALIDRTSETCDTVYDERYDSFFCFGIKNSGSIYTVSDRVTWSSPEHAYKTRNPGRDFEQKLDYSYFPYGSLKEIKNALPANTQLLTDGIENNLDTASLFDASLTDEECLYLGILSSLVYSKYFINPEGVEAPVKYFTSDVHFLAPGETRESKALVASDVCVQLPAVNTTANDYCGTDRIFNTGLYDYLIDEYPLPESESKALINMSNCVCTLEEMQNLAWWNIRKKQAEHIEAELNENHREKEQAISDWFEKHFKSTACSIFKHMVMSPPYDELHELHNLSGDGNNENGPLLWEEFRDGKELKTASVLHDSDKYSFDPDRRDYEDVFVDDMHIRFCNWHGSYVHAWLPEDNNSRAATIKLILRSHTDFERFFDVKNEDLPKEIRHHFYARRDSWTAYGWKPYDGNSILHFCDPMNDIRNPYYDIGFVVELHVSKTMLKKFKKTQKEASK